MWQAEVDGHLLPIEPDCNALTHSHGEYFRKREAFLQDSTAVRTPASRKLAADIRRVLDRSRLDIAALRLYDLDEGEHNWKLAAGVPTYMALSAGVTIASTGSCCRSNATARRQQWGTERCVRSPELRSDAPQQRRVSVSEGVQSGYPSPDSSTKEAYGAIYHPLT